MGKGSSYPLGAYGQFIILWSVVSLRSYFIPVVAVVVRLVGAKTSSNPGA